MGKVSKEKWQTRFFRLKAQVGDLSSQRSPWYESNLFWVPLGFAVTAVLMVVAAMRDVLWVLWLAWVFVFISLRTVVVDVQLWWKRGLVVIAVVIPLAIGHWWLYGQLSRKALSLNLDPSLHQEEGNGSCYRFFVDVENLSMRTISDVSVKIERLVEVDSGENIISLEGLTLAVAGSWDPPYTPPKSSVTLQIGDRGVFSVVRMCKSSHGNFSILHSSYVKSHFNRMTNLQMWQGKPQGSIAFGHYLITLIPRGTDAIGESVTFEFWSSPQEVFFQEVVKTK